MNFFVKYLSLAVIASIAVYGFAPLFVNREKPQALVKHASRMHPVSAETSLEPVEEIPLVPVDQVPGAGPAEKKIQTADAGVSKAPSAPVEAAPSVPPAEEEEPEVIVETVRGYTPSTDTIRPSGPNIQYWGVTLKETALFEPDGKRREDKLAGGSLIEQVGGVKSSKGEMAKVRVWRGSAWAGVYLVSTADLIRFEGGREEVDAEGVADLCRYFSLSSRLERRKTELKQLAASKNPHYVELKSLATTYNANVEKAKRMTKERDHAKGAKRAQIADALRSLEIENKRVEIKVKALTKKYEAWKASHGVETVSFESDAQIRAIDAEMAKIKPKLTLFGI